MMTPPPIIVSIAWALLALVHLMPAWAFFRPEQMRALYRISADNPFYSLMHHRAALFVVIVLLCVWAIADPAVRRMAAVGVGFSMLSFLWIFWRAGQPSELKTIAMVDLIGLLPLTLVAWAAIGQRE